MGQDINDVIERLKFFYIIEIVGNLRGWIFEF